MSKPQGKSVSLPSNKESHISPAQGTVPVFNSKKASVKPIKQYDDGRSPVIGPEAKYKGTKNEVVFNDSK